MAETLTLLPGERTTRRAGTNRERWRGTARTGPAPSGLLPDEPIPATAGTRCLCCHPFCSAEAGSAAVCGLVTKDVTTDHAYARAADAATGVGVEPKDLATARAGVPALDFTVGGPAPVTECLALEADPIATSDAVGSPHSGGIDLPRAVFT